MPWQLSGNGRSDWSTKLIRGLKAEAAAGFQSRRERCRESTPVTPQYAAFPTYKAARVHHGAWRYSGSMATCGASAADGNAGGWGTGQFFVSGGELIGRGLERDWLHRRAECSYRISLGARGLRPPARNGR